MKLRMRHLAAIIILLVTLVAAIVTWLLVGSLGAATVAGLVIAAWVGTVWRVRRNPDYHERKQLYLRFEQWLGRHSCGDLLEVDCFIVQCCPHLIGPHVRMWPQCPEDRNVRVDDYMLQGLVAGIRHAMMIGTVNDRGEVEVPQPTSLRALVHRERFEQDSGLIETSLAELRDLLDQLDRATPVLAQP